MVVPVRPLLPEESTTWRAIRLAVALDGHLPAMVRRRGLSYQYALPRCLQVFARKEPARYQLPTRPDVQQTTMSYLGELPVLDLARNEADRDMVWRPAFLL